MISILVLISMGCALGYILSRFASGKDRGFLFRLFVIAFLLRIIVSFSLYLVSLNSDERPGGFLGRDDFVYLTNAIVINQLMREGVIPFNDVFRRYKDDEFSQHHYLRYHNMPTGRLSSYDVWNTYLLFMTGGHPLNLFVFNCFLGALLVLVTFFLGREIFGSQVGRVAAMLSAFWPSLFFWSTLLLKDSLISLCIMVLVLCALLMRKDLKYLILLPVAVISIKLLGIFRTPLDQLFTATLVIAWVISDSRLRRILLTVFIISYFLIPGELHKVTEHIREKFLVSSARSPVILSAIRPGESLEQQYLVEQLQTEQLARAGWGVLRPSWEAIHDPSPNKKTTLSLTAVSDSGDLKRLLSIAALICILVPFPWSPLPNLFSIAEMSVWYLLLPATFWGIYHGVKKRLEWSIFPLLSAMAYATVLGIVATNIGLLFRVKAAVIYLLLVFTAAGLVYWFRFKLTREFLRPKSYF